MSTVAEIESAIEKLSPRDQQALREWLLARDRARKPVLQKLRSLAGTAKNLPADLAANHDHYLHGWTDDDWDRQMKRDAAAGKFSALNREAETAYASGKTRPLGDMLDES